MNWSAAGAAALALAVIFGAFGAHALRDRKKGQRDGTDCERVHHRLGEALAQ